MIDVAPRIKAIYATLGEPVTPAAGAEFHGILSIADASVFDAVHAGQIELRYPESAATLQRGDVVQTRGRSYRVVEPPRRIGDGRECVATLTEVAS